MTPPMRTLRVFGLAVALAPVRSCSPGDQDDVAARPVSGSVRVDGAELKGVREGQGPPVFVLDSAVHYPRAFSARLRNRFELVFV